MLLTFYRFINNSGVDFPMIVDIDKLSVDYSGIKALDDISFGIDEGDFLGIIGPNGAGKSTLFKCMLGLHTQYDGTIRVFGQDVRDSRKYLSQIGYVPQTPVVDRNFPATIREVLSMSQNSSDPKKWMKHCKRFGCTSWLTEELETCQLVSSSVSSLQRHWSTRQKF